MASKNDVPNTSTTDEIDFDAFNWDEVEASVEEVREQGHKAKRIEDVPAKIVADAQKSRDNKKVYKVTFPTNAIAMHYAKLMRNAGPHVKPPAGMYVKCEEGSKTVEYSAGEPRGRKTTTEAQESPETAAESTTETGE